MEAADIKYSLKNSRNPINEEEETCSLLHQGRSPNEIQAAYGLVALQDSVDSVACNNGEPENLKASKIRKEKMIMTEDSSSDESEEDSSSDETNAYKLYNLATKKHEATAIKKPNNQGRSIHNHANTANNNGESEKPKVAIKTGKALIKKSDYLSLSRSFHENSVHKLQIDTADNNSEPEKPEAVIKKARKKRKIVEEDDTEETLQLLLQRLNNGESKIPPPDPILSKIPNAVKFSRCIYKQLTESDVNGGQSRLMLGKKEVKDKFLCLLEASEIPGVEGVDVSVYGPDGESHEMKFKMWNKDTPVLMNGWSKFVEAYGLQKYSDVLTIWMFRASEDGKICFVIDSIRFDDITKPLSKRILKNVFQKVVFFLFGVVPV